MISKRRLAAADPLRRPFGSHRFLQLFVRVAHFERSKRGKEDIILLRAGSGQILPALFSGKRRIAAGRKAKKKRGVILNPVQVSCDDRYDGHFVLFMILASESSNAVTPSVAPKPTAQTMDGYGMNSSSTSPNCEG